MGDERASARISRAPSLFRMPQKLAGKVVLIIAVYALPLGALALYFLITGLNDKINFANKELAGNRYLRPLVSMLAVAGDYRTIPADGGNGRRARLKTEMEAALASLREIDAADGALLQFTPEGLGSRGRQNARADRLAERWNELSSGKSRDWDGFEEQLRVMITHAGDTSNLILDPDLDSYYLMDATLLALPTNLSRLGEVERLALALPEGGEPGQAELLGLAVHSAMLKKDDLDRLTADMETAFNEDRNFSGVSPTLASSLKPVLAQYNESLGKLVKLSSCSDASAGVCERAKLLAAAGEARASACKLWVAAVAELDTLLELRIEGFRTERALALATAAAILIASTLLSWLILRTLTRPINEMVAMMHEVAQGEADLRKRLKADMGGELGQLAASFNQFVERLQSLASGTAGVTTHLSQVAREVEGYSKRVSEGAGQQAALLQESGASLSAIGHAASDIDANAKNLSEIVESSTSTAENLTRISQDITGQSRRLTEAAATVTEETGKLATASRKISLATVDLSTKADELAATSDQIVASIRHVREGADTTSKLSQKVSADVAEGIGAVEATIRGIVDLKMRTDASARIIEGLKERTDSIDLVLNFISDLNDQTSLLALNANIIAAQAGEKGHGFAVIANEVRALAARTAQSAKEIEQMTKGLRKGANDAAQAMEAATLSMEAEVARANLAGSALKKIGDSATSSLEQVMRIVLVTQEQAQGSSRLTEVAEETTALVSKVAKAIKEQDEGVRALNDLASDLRDIVKQVDENVVRQVEQIDRIALASERIQEMSSPIETKTREQNRRTAALLDALDRIMAEADKNSSLANGLGEAVEAMAKKADSLKVEMGRFQV